MANYCIYVANKLGRAQNYSFLLDQPSVSAGTPLDKIYSNVFLSKNVESNDCWAIDVTETYAAWCGTTHTKLASGVNVSMSNARLANLGSHSLRGSTFTISNNMGSPIFEGSVEYTAADGSFQIKTQPGWEPGQNLLGLGCIDSNGSIKPAATVEAPSDAMVSIKPVSTFWVVALDYTVGTAIDLNRIENVAAKIDFSNNPGMFGATVVQDVSGAFIISYHQQADFAAAVAEMKGGLRSLNVDLELKTTLRHALRLLDLKSDRASKVNVQEYRCTATWVNCLTDTQKQAIIDHTLKNMSGLNYSVKAGADSNLPMWAIIAAHVGNWSAALTHRDWAAACGTLPENLKGFVSDLDVKSERGPGLQKQFIEGAPDPLTVAPLLVDFTGWITWMANVNNGTKTAVKNNMIVYMQNRAYQVADNPDGPTWSAMLAHAAPWTLAQTQADWQNGIAALPAGQGAACQRWGVDVGGPPSEALGILSIDAAVEEGSKEDDPKSVEVETAPA